MKDYSESELRNIEALNLLFEGDGEVDRLALFDQNAVWWNGLPHIGSPPGNTERVGIESIAQMMASSQDPSAPSRGVDAYDLSKTVFEDVVVLADGEFVMRQHTQKSKTLTGRDYCNVYCFVVKFSKEGKILHVTEHWNTWYAHKFLLDNYELEPAHPNLQHFSGD